ncbi:hypothetical protein GCK72_012668 [Caenorhabditis remanei]|uniref:Uncharacterized protein n=1 Tax=Caenorhabditis remanei TaxID=31234 RepID=A0A6A5GNS1_CAERE|nr:hypothetical protein GCK72_012668 [Caenorhabditis remanei]KAF1756215.1 hypothetical protein GCK72_012668 [Caenorhabditis remanei]
METLQNTCIQVLANCIKECYAKLIDGLRIGEEFKIPSELRNRIFEILTKTPLRLSSDTAHEISKVFNVTKVILTSSIINDASIELLQSFNLVELELKLLDLKKEENTGEEEIDDEEYLSDDEEYSFDIIATLDSILNSKSRKSLRVLKIYGYKTKFNGEWIEQIAKVLGPVLQHLDINSYRLSWGQSKPIFNRFSNLTELNASHTHILLAEGISQLKNLKNLTLAGVKLGLDDFKELFKLRKLHFLNLSNLHYDPYMGFIKYSFQEESPHPELKVLDISACGYDLREIAKLIEVYPKLETIGLIGYELPPNTNTEIPGVKLHLNTTVEQCLDSLDYYLNNWGFEHETIVEIIRKIYRECIWTTFLFPEQLKIQCLDKIIEALDHGPRFTNILVPLLALTNLIDENRLQGITAFQRHSLAKYLLGQEPPEERPLLYFTLFQRCFTSDAFLATRHINYSMVCNKTIDFVLREVSDCTYHILDVLETGVSILSRCLCKMSRSDENFQTKRFDCMFNYMMTASNQRSRQAAVAILVHVFSFSTNRNMTGNQKSQLMTEIMS